MPTISNRRVEPVGVFALIGLVEGGLDSGKARIGDLAFNGAANSVVCSWFWSRKLAVAQKNLTSADETSSAGNCLRARSSVRRGGLRCLRPAPFFRSARPGSRK